ncbi:MAG: hypothetical protein FWD81_01340 [Methanomassiliicoccaceae archaeon]|nr:hypothetical protein [Methanomassiliicoccaceae archaeon]
MDAKCLTAFATVAILVLAVSFAGVGPDRDTTEDKYVRTVDLSNTIEMSNWALEEYDEYNFEFFENKVQFIGMVSFNASELFSSADMEMMSIQEDDIITVENVIEVTENNLRIDMSFNLGDESLSLGALSGLPVLNDGKADAVFKIDGTEFYLSELVQDMAVENCILPILLVGALLVGAAATTAAVTVTFTVMLAVVVLVAAAALITTYMVFDHFNLFGFGKGASAELKLNRVAGTVTVGGTVYSVVELNKNFG